jgi:hypothetical protein
MEWFLNMKAPMASSFGVFHGNPRNAKLALKALNHVYIFPSQAPPHYLPP